MERKAFEKVLKTAKKIVPVNGSMPILRCVRLEGDGETLRVSGTSLKTSFSLDVPCSWRGNVAVNLKELLAAVGGKGAEVELGLVGEGEGARLRVSSGGAVHTLSTFPSDECPVRPAMGEVKGQFEVDGKGLAAALKRCAPMMSNDETRPNIYGMNLMVLEGETVQIEALDGHRLIQENHLPASRVKGTFAPTIIQREAVPALLDCIRGKVQVIEGADQILFIVEGVGDVMVRRVEAEFPPVECVIPKDPDRSVTCNRAALALAWKGAVAALKAAGGKSTMAKITFEQGEVRVSVDYPETGTFLAVVPCQCAEGTTMGFNARYFLDALEACEGEDVTLELRGELEGAKIREEARTVVVMPVRV